MTPPPPSGRAAATLAFDRLAPDYDVLVDGEIFRHLRARTHQAFARRFRPGARVIEIGCGTGLDTCFLVSNGVQVLACDPSEEMVSRTLRRLAYARREDQATVLPCGLQGLAPFLDALAEPHGFDGIVSNFGALNCVKDLAPLGALAKQYVRPGGIVMLGLMARTCALEVLYFLATRRPDMASRRRGEGPVSVSVAGVEVPTFYHRIADVRSALGPDLSLAAVEGIGVAVPPPYLELRWRSLPKSVRGVVTRLDTWIAPWPPFNRVGDHVLLHFEKQSAAHA